MERVRAFHLAGGRDRCVVSGRFALRSGQRDDRGGVAYAEDFRHRADDAFLPCGTEFGVDRQGDRLGRRTLGFRKFTGGTALPGPPRLLERAFAELH